MLAKCGVGTARCGRGGAPCTAKTVELLFCTVSCEWRCWRWRGGRTAAAVAPTVDSFVATSTQHSYCLTKLFALVISQNSIIKLIPVPAPIIGTKCFPNDNLSSQLINQKFNLECIRLKVKIIHLLNI